HGLGGEQDMERMGGLGTRMRITFVTMAAGTLAIAGVPPFSGFFSKDEILWNACAGAFPVLGVIGLLVAFLTAFYTGRLFCMTFFGECRASEDVQHHLHESPAVMTLPLVVLAVLACAGGFLDVPGLLGGEGHEAHAPLAFMLLATALAAGGLGLAWALYVKWPGLPSLVAWRLGAFYRLVRDKFRVDELYGAALLALLLREEVCGIRRAALAFALVTLVLSLEMLRRFQVGVASFQMAEQVAWIPQWGIEYRLGVDGVSLFLVLLTTVLTPIVVLASWGDIHRRVKEFFAFLLVLETGMLGTL